MTHDELLAKIDETEEWISSTPLSLEFQTRLLNQYKALRAVVELHQPQPDHCPCCPPVLCECAEVYPCPTIQAIERELG